MTHFPEFERFTVGKCARCNYLASIDVGVDVRINDCVEFECPKCKNTNLVIASVRGIEPGFERRTYRTEAVPGTIRNVQSTDGPGF